MNTPTLFEIAGRHMNTYDALYREVDPEDRGYIGASEAALFMKRSKLDTKILGRIWDLSDQNLSGSLDRVGLFIALKLIALAQQGYDVNLQNILMEIAPPNILPQQTDPSTMINPSDTWAIKEAEQAKYTAIFNSLGPLDGKLSGDKVRPVLLNSGLPTNILGKIWELSDIDKDGYLDAHEMCVALHLVYRSLENDQLPSTLAIGLVPPEKRHLAGRSRTMSTSERQRRLSSGSSSGDYAIPAPTDRRISLPIGAVQVLPPSTALTRVHRSRASSITSVESTHSTHVTPYSTVQDSGHTVEPVRSSVGSRSLSSTPISMSHQIQPPVAWIIDKMNYESVFIEVDTNKDGFVNGADVKGLLLGSGLAQNYLAHIWSLVDINKTGMLNLEQFALAMYLIEQKKDYNIDPPPTLPPDLIPPSFRPSPAGMTDISTSTQDVDQSGAHLGGAVTPSGSKEIDSLTAEMEGFNLEKRNIESSVVQLEADMTVKQSEIKNLEVELNTLDSTVKQLERQKGEANRRLNDLDCQRDALQKTFSELQQKFSMEEQDVNSMKSEIENATASAQQQENELNNKRFELQQMREEENRLEVSLQNGKANLDTAAQQYGTLERQIQQTESTMNQINAHTSKLEEKLVKLEQILSSGDVTELLKNEAFLLENVQPTKANAIENPQIITQSATPEKPQIQQYEYHLLSAHSSYSSFSTYYDTVADENSGLAGSTGAFARPSTSTPRIVSDPYKQADPFVAAAPSTNGISDPFASNDPFANSDPFAQTQPVAVNDPFAAGPDPFAGSFDAFGGGAANDPFAPAPGSGSQQGSPKKAPPRPAPPKNRPTTPKQPLNDPFTSPTSDPFASSGSGNGGGFANFADFSNFS